MLFSCFLFEFIYPTVHVKYEKSIVINMLELVASRIIYISWRGGGSVKKTSESTWDVMEGTRYTNTYTVNIQHLRRSVGSNKCFNAKA
jgi:hypothetical protein